MLNNICIYVCIDVGMYANRDTCKHICMYVCIQNVSPGNMSFK